MILNNIAKNLSSYDDNILYSENPTNKIKEFSAWSESFKKDHVEIQDKELNSLNFRSDEFIDKHDKTHILFSGCSQTFGTGLFKEELWTSLLYDLIKKDLELSGYFNLATPGASIGHIVSNIFKYFKKYGDPDIIFLNLPGPNRTYNYDKEKKIIHDGRFSDDCLPFLNILSYQYYFMLEHYCIKNNIKLFAFSWHEQGNLLMNKNFKNFIFINEDDIISYIFQKYGNLKLGRLARDNGHLGIGFHEYWSKYLYDKFIK
jgi:hypothetical protein